MLSMNAQSSIQSIAIIGLGEAGAILAKALATENISVTTFDIKLNDDKTRYQIEERAQHVGVHIAESAEGAIKNAELIFSTVTASQAETVAREIALFMNDRQTFIDLNSVSPKVKQRNSHYVQSNGGIYVEAAVMAPVPPHGIKVPMLLGGNESEKVSQVLNMLGMKTQSVSLEVGVASAIKLCRSIMIKGMEALCTQSMMAANAFGIDDKVLDSLHASFPSMGWDNNYESYLIGRVVEHGQRRSEEMHEAAAMLGDIGMNTILANAVAEIQEQLANMGREKSLLKDIDAKGALPEWRDLLRVTTESSNT